MERLGKGNATPKKREGRARLSPRGPLIETLLGGIQFDGFDIEQTRRFGNALLAARNKWADTHRHGRRHSDAEYARQNGSLIRKGGRS